MKYYYKEKYVVAALIVFVVILCFSSIFFLPSIEETAFGSRSGKFGVRRWGNGEDRDRRAFLNKVRGARFPAVWKEELFQSDEDDNTEKRRAFIRNMTLFAWENYRKYAWGSNELRPLSRIGHSSSIFGKGEMGATIVDAIDTLYIMGLRKEYEEARIWIVENLDFTSVEGDISVFETTIRFIGGLLSAYALTDDEVFLSKAETIANILLPAFETDTGIPLAAINVGTEEAHNWGWSSSGCSILSEFGSLHLEFEYLSRVTNNSVFSEKVSRIRNVLSSLHKPNGLYSNYLNPKTGKWGEKHVSVGAFGDSFYEYLLKSWLLSGKKDTLAKDMYDSAIAAIEKKLLRYSKRKHLAYFAEIKGTRIEHKMDHLACFIAGMYALESMVTSNSSRKAYALHLAEEIGNTCHESYIQTETGLGPESFRFVKDVEAVAVYEREKYYIQRPEVIEGWFYLYRATKDAKYRDWSWQAAQSIEKYCKTVNGYCGIRDVYTTDVDCDDVQQTFLFAETFKYLYLIFSSDNVLPLDKWVFNTEAHPFPI